MRLNSFMSWIGGKKALRELIVTLFPVYYERYIEVFGGGGWVLFHKPPGNDFEVYNDFNSLLVNLYRCVRDKPQELMEALRYVLNSREDFDVVRATLARDSPASDVQKAAWFYELIRYSYAAGLTSFGSQPHDMWSNFPLIEQAHRRLAKVVIENKDFEKLIRQYDRPASLFYLDPPYDIENLAPTRGGAAYAGETTTDRYGRKIPKHAVGTENFSYTSSANDLLETITALYDRIVDKALLVRRLSISANRLLHEEKVPKQDEVEQLDLFTDYAAKEKQKAENAAEHARERKIQETILGIKKKFGKNAILKGLNLEDGATARERNQTIGGHQA